MRPRPARRTGEVELTPPQRDLTSTFEEVSPSHCRGVGTHPMPRDDMFTPSTHSKAVKHEPAVLPITPCVTASDGRPTVLEGTDLTLLSKQIESFKVLMFKEREAHAAELKAVRAKHDAELTKVEEAHRMELLKLSAKLENESSEVKEARDTIDAQVLVLNELSQELAVKEDNLASALYHQARLLDMTNKLASAVQTHTTRLVESQERKNSELTSASLREAKLARTLDIEALHAKGLARTLVHERRQRLTAQRTLILAQEEHAIRIRAVARSPPSLTQLLFNPEFQTPPPGRDRAMP